jgi:hypothetical protein
MFCGNKAGSIVPKPYLEYGELDVAIDVADCADASNAITESKNVIKIPEYLIIIVLYGCI